MPEMTEREVALKIAEQWLDFKFNPMVQMVPGEPDCDAVRIARQYVRAIEREHVLKVILATLAEVTSELLKRIDLSDIPAVARAEDIVGKVLSFVRQTSPIKPASEEDD
jgi:hypothetical protein